MQMLLLQTFLLMLAAFLLGAMTSCLVKRTVYGLADDEDTSEPEHVHISPDVMTRREPVGPATTPVPEVSAADTQRFERALTGDVADIAAAAHAAAARGPMIEVQPLPAPPVVVVAPPAAARAAEVVEVVVPQARPAPAEDRRTYAEIAVASHDGSTLGPETVQSVVLPAPTMPGPSPEPLPVPRVAIPSFERPADAPPDPDLNYIAAALAITGGYAPRPDPEPPAVSFPPYVYPAQEDEAELQPGQTYAAIAVASHDGSMLPPETARSVQLPPPVMPGPAPAALEVPRVTIPRPVRPADAPPDPVLSYAAAALASNGEYVPTPDDFVRRDIELQPYDDTRPVEIPPEGQTYASLALSDLPAPDSVVTTLATNAVAAAAGLAAERAAQQGADDDLTRIVGIDDVIASRLNYAGISRYAQVAAWSADDIGYLSQSLGFFGRIEQEDWVGQARRLLSSAAPASAHDADVPPPAAPVRATAFNAADTATAAAAAAAAAMAAAKPPRTPQPDFDQNDFESKSADDAPLTRADLSALRSVRSEGLLGADADFVRGDIDDLKRIRGIGVLIEKKLNSLGVTSYEQLANWSGADIDRISDILDFKGRIERENWVEQARILASGGQTEFSRRVDKGEV